MRNRFSKILTEVAKQDEQLILLVGDIGFNVFDDFIETFPKKFLNAGVAESNMIGTGLQECHEYNETNCVYYNPIFINENF